MATGVKGKKPVKNSNESLKSVVNARWFRPVAALLVGVIAFGVILYMNNRDNAPYADAKKVANIFLTAYGNCDYKTVAKYDVSLSDPNGHAALSFKQQCVKGVYTFTYEKRLTASTKTTKDGTSKTVTFVYGYTNSQNQNTGTFAVKLLKDSKSNDWMIYSLTPANSTQPSTQQQQ